MTMESLGAPCSSWKRRKEAGAWTSSAMADSSFGFHGGVDRRLTRIVMEETSGSVVAWCRWNWRRGPAAPVRRRRRLRHLGAKLGGQFLHSEAPVDGDH